MKQKAVCMVIVSVFLLFSMLCTGTQKVKAEATTVIYTDPPISYAPVGEVFSIDIRVTNVTNLYAWQFFLNWTPSLLEATNLTEGPFLKTVGKTRLSSFIDNDGGIIRATNTLQGVDVFDAPSGNGTIAYVTFRVEAEGECPLHLSETMLIRYKGPHEPPTLIDHDPKDGYFKFPLPVMYVDPSSVLNATLGPGSSFTINVSVIRVTDLYSWNFSLYWKPDILNVTNVIEGPFLNQSGAYNTTFISEVNQTGGYVHANCTLVESVPGVNGNGTIATLTFLVEATGDTYLSLPINKTWLFDSGHDPIVHLPVGGYFSNELPDIAVTNVEASPTTVKPGDSVTINVTVKNTGITNETLIDVAVTTPSPSYNFIGTQNITSLDSGQEVTLTFSWNTKGVAQGKYTVRANASTVPGEIDTENNHKDVTVKIASPDQTLIIVIAAVIAVAVIVIAVFLYKRRKPRGAS